MFKFASLASLALVAAFSNHAAAEVLFEGTAVFTAVSNCQFLPAVDQTTSRYHPRVLGNQNFTGLSFTYMFSSAGYKLVGKNFGPTFKNVESGGTGYGDNFTWTGSQILISEQNPATIDLSTRFVTLRGRIKKHYNDPGIGGQPCIGDFEAAYIRDPQGS
jgi:hypothetical protein